LPRNIRRDFALQTEAEYEINCLANRRATKKGTPMGLRENLMYGRLAVDFVRRLSLRTNSRLHDMQTMSNDEWRDVNKCMVDDPNHPYFDPNSVRSQFKTFCQEKGLATDTCLQQLPGAVEKMVQLAVTKKCGNCTEQSAVALWFLKVLHVRPLDLMELNSYNANVDHAFVVIGRIAAPHEVDDPFAKECRLIDGSIDKDTSTWGRDAVVCDPWHDRGKIYPATEIQTKVFRGNFNFRGTVQPKSIVRID
jgi:hypothetical protein